MPPKFVASSESPCVLRGQTLTNSECNVLFSALSNLLAPLEINMEAAALSAGLKPNSYKEMLRQLKKKYDLGNPNAAAAAGDSGEGDCGFTPVKKRTAAEADPNGEVMEDSPAKKKTATPRKPRITAKMKREAEAAAAAAAAAAQTAAVDDGYATATEGGADNGEI
ncbi:hypothetical protein SMACR_04180 [Sordaria macrospora]|uniref:WGS project CABT00000000 data, contig 2.15 n=2 Tax=Sordaria macrospora TaxID=5147 RepID=F7VZK3_SORMK|nr:uncharacterized protein SMAC_04180 [Sordaria macrospora k-hell]KAA8628930.1 hypothetical protein SMACR_04180 [Sordaria macrospora]WPJ64475.1 hypothetical protein SMAC4_04180 [Sordaria macrospora]CCC10951.1 unnamed protein product [Sordaria macrospora k-hell]